MKKLAFIPKASSWLSAAFLFGLLQGMGALWMALLPLILELLERSPRLAMMVIAGLVLPPAVVVTLVHHATNGALDRVDADARSRRGLLPGVASVWAGVHGWLVLFGTSTLTTVVMLVIFPPEPDPDARAFLMQAATFAGGGAVASLQSAIWIVIAAELYNVERLARR